MDNYDRLSSDRPRTPSVEGRLGSAERARVFCSARVSDPALKPTGGLPASATRTGPRSNAGAPAGHWRTFGHRRVGGVGDPRPNSTSSCAVGVGDPRRTRSVSAAGVSETRVELGHRRAGGVGDPRRDSVRGAAGSETRAELGERRGRPETRARTRESAACGGVGDPRAENSVRRRGGVGDPPNPVSALAAGPETRRTRNTGQRAAAVGDPRRTQRHFGSCSVAETPAKIARTGPVPLPVLCIFWNSNDKSHSRVVAGSSGFDDGGAFADRCGRRNRENYCG